MCIYIYIIYIRIYVDNCSPPFNDLYIHIVEKVDVFNLGVYNSKCINSSVAPQDGHFSSFWRIHKVKTAKTAKPGHG